VTSCRTRKCHAKESDCGASGCCPPAATAAQSHYSAIAPAWVAARAPAASASASLQPSRPLADSATSTTSRFTPQRGLSGSAGVALGEELGAPGQRVPRGELPWRAGKSSAGRGDVRPSTSLVELPGVEVRSDPLGGCQAMVISQLRVAGPPRPAMFALYREPVIGTRGGLNNVASASHH
jgi:hypothetical protein